MPPLKCLRAFTHLAWPPVCPGLVAIKILFCWLFSNKKQCKKVCFRQTHTHSRFASVNLGGVLAQPGTSTPSKTHTPMSLGQCSSRSNSRGEVEGPSRALTQLKKPFKGPSVATVLAGRKVRERCFLEEEVIFLKQNR